MSTREQILALNSGEATLRQFLGLSEPEIQAIACFGFDLYQQGRYADARVVFDGLNAIDPSSYYGPAGLGAIALLEEKLEEAEPFLRTAVQLHPTDPSVHCNLGECLLRQGKCEEAASHLHRAIELDPERKDPGAQRAGIIVAGMQLVIAEVQRSQQAASQTATV